MLLLTKWFRICNSGVLFRGFESIRLDTSSVILVLVVVPLTLPIVTLYSITLSPLLDYGNLLTEYEHTNNHINLHSIILTIANVLRLSFIISTSTLIFDGGKPLVDIWIWL